MIEPSRRLGGAGLELSTRTDRQAGFDRPRDRQAVARQSTRPAASPAAPGTDSPAELNTSGLKVPARLVPAGQQVQHRATGLPVELRLLDPGSGGPAAGRAPGLLATVLGSSAAGGLVLDLGGHRLTLPPGAVERPIGACLTIRLRLPGTTGLIGDRSTLDRLIGAWLGQQTAMSAEARPGDPPLAPDAGLAARLIADWRAMAGRNSGVAAPQRDVSGKRPSSRELRIDGETGRSLLVDCDTDWRGLFGLLGQSAEPAQPVTLWRRERAAGGADDKEQQLILTLDLSRLGRIVLELGTAPGRLRLAVGSPEPLPAPLRAEIAEAFRAATALAGIEPALVFRAAPAVAIPLGNDSRHHSTDWLG
jgi:hypothetical protein